MRRIVLALLLAAVAAAKEKNLLENGGFEQELTGWRIHAPSGMRHDFDRKEKKEGRRSIHLEKAGRGGMDNLHVRLENLAAGQTLEVRAWFKADRVGNGWFKVFFHDAAGSDLGQGDDVKPLAGTYDWKRIELSNEVPPGAVGATVFVLLVMPGELWVDGAEAVLTGEAKAQRPPDPLDKAMQRWLDRNTVAIDTLDFGAPTRDLAPLRRLVGDARIVQLGEQSHMDGASFRAKARLARFFHESMGFQVIAFESGLFECEAANALLAEGKAREALHASVFGIWRTEEVLPLFEHMARHAKGRAPLVLTGFDMRGSGSAAAELLPRLCDLLGPVPEDDLRMLTAIDAQLGVHPYEPADPARGAARKALDRLADTLEARRNALVRNHGEREVAFLERCLRNYALREEFEWQNQVKGDSDSAGNLRDRQMAENLRWLAEERYPGSKILTWAATSHQARNLKKVTIGGSSKQYETWKNMGQYVHEWYGDEVFTIAFAAHGGKAGRFRPMFDLQPPREGSVEDLLHRYGKPLLFLPLRGDAGPFAGRLFCSPMAYGRDMEAPWPEVVDAILFTEVMTPTVWVPRD